VPCLPISSLLVAPMSSSRDRAGEALSRLITSGIWLLATVLVLHWGTPSAHSVAVEANGSSSLGANLAPDERAAPRSAYLGEQASRVSAHWPGNSDSGGSDQDAVSIQSDARQPGFALAIAPAAPDDKDVRAQRSRSFSARAPPTIA
jgi:hypothetical protein